MPIAFVLIELALVVVALALWYAQPTAAIAALGANASWYAKIKHWISEQNKSLRLATFVLVTIVPPIWFLVQWLYYPPAPAELAVYEYGQKLSSDVWVSVAAVAAAVFGIKKS